MSFRTPQPPKNIRPEAIKLWREVWKGWELDSKGASVLAVACISYSRFLDAREAIDRDGITFATETGIKKNPAVEVEKVSRVGFLQAMRDLNLGEAGDDEKKNIGRPWGRM